MPLQPEFMLKFEEFNAERQRVRTLEDWLAFRKKWFDSSQWPTQGPDQLVAVVRKKSPLRLGGRLWCYTYYEYDIRPEARYEEFASYLTLGQALQFPHRKPFEFPNRGWNQWCPYCEISTSEKGEEICPQCGRRLLYECIAD